jgi:hypothetical protein
MHQSVAQSPNFSHSSSLINYQKQYVLSTFQGKEMILNNDLSTDYFDIGRKIG